MAEQSVPSGIAAAAWYDNNVVVQALVANAYERGVAAGRAQAAADLRFAAEGRAEYARAASPEHRELLAFEAGTLDHAAAVAGGDIQPLYGWVPSRMWTPEMNAKLAEEAP